MKIPLILASQSPRRRMLLEQAGYPFTVNAPPESVECGICTDRGPFELVAELAHAKAAYIAKQTERGLVLAADTIACCKGRILGKPQNRDHAREILEFMSGCEHLVLTGVTLWLRPEDIQRTHVEKTVLTMKKLDPDWLNEYLDSCDWEGKAGAFGYQDGIDWVTITDGSANNVVGLPVEKLDGWIAELMQSSGSDS